MKRGSGERAGGVRTGMQPFAMRRAGVRRPGFVAVLCLACLALPMGPRLTAAASPWVNVNPGAGGA